MFKNETRKEYEDFQRQIEAISSLTTIDMDGNGSVDVTLIKEIMALLGEPKCPQEKLDEITKVLIGESQTVRIPLDEFLTKIRPYLSSYGSQKEFLEAFKIFDEDGSGKIPINAFRFFMLKYAKMEPAEMDEMICDILDMKKVAPIDSSTKIDYMQFSEKLFNKDYKPPKKDAGKGGKGGKGGKK